MTRSGEASELPRPDVRLLMRPDTRTDLGGGACFDDARVQVERIESEPNRG